MLRQDQQLDLVNFISICCSKTGDLKDLISYACSLMLSRPVVQQLTQWQLAKVTGKHKKVYLQAQQLFQTLKYCESLKAEMKTVLRGCDTLDKVAEKARKHHATKTEAPTDAELLNKVRAQAKIYDVVEAFELLQITVAKLTKANSDFINQPVQSLMAAWCM